MVPCRLSEGDSAEIGLDDTGQNLVTRSGYEQNWLGFRQLTGQIDRTMNQTMLSQIFSQLKRERIIIWSALFVDSLSTDCAVKVKNYSFAAN